MVIGHEGQLTGVDRDVPTYGSPDFEAEVGGTDIEESLHKRWVSIVTADLINPPWTASALEKIRRKIRLCTGGTLAERWFLIMESMSR